MPVFRRRVGNGRRDVQRGWWSRGLSGGLAFLLLILVLGHPSGAWVCPPLVGAPSQEELAQLRARVHADPEDAFAWDDLGEGLLKRCDLPEAAEAFGRARELGLQVADRHISAARNHFQTGDWHRALVLYEHIAAFPAYLLSPPPEVGVNLASIYFRLGRAQEVSPILARTLTGNYDAPWVYRAVARLLEMSTPLREASIQHALGQEGMGITALGGRILLGLAYHASGQWDEAAGEYAAALSILRVYAAREAVLWVYLGRTFLMAGRLREAEAAVRVAINRRMILPDAHYWLGRILFSQGRVQEAVDAWRTAIAQDPEHVEAADWLRRATGR
jgi:tetratricopeptide (TPR) repeat protein